MAKDPAALFYIDAWLVATKEMKADCRGWFLNLILHQFKNGSLPNDIEELANLADVRISEFETFKQVWQHVLKQKFELLPTGRLAEPEQAAIIRGREEFIKKRSAAGRISAFSKFIRRHLCQDENVIFFVQKHVNIEQIETNDQQVLKQVFQDLYQLYINKNKNRNTGDMNRGMGEGKGGGPPAESAQGWNQFPGKSELELELPDVQANCALELLVLNGTKAERPHIDRLWQVFKNQHFTGKKYYHSPEDAFHHFINWAKTQKINGASQESTNGSTKLGTSAARLEALKKW